MRSKLKTTVKHRPSEARPDRADVVRRFTQRHVTPVRVITMTRRHGTWYLDEGSTHVLKGSRVVLEAYLRRLGFEEEEG